MRAVDSATRDAFLGIQLLISDYWDEVDTNEARRAPDYYTETCSFAPGTGKVFRDRAGVREFYSERAKRGNRTTRHFGSNLTLTLDGSGRAIGNYIVALYASDGDPPIIDCTGPAAVIDLKCAFERGADGQWRFASVEGYPVFIASEPYVRASLVNAKET